MRIIIFLFLLISSNFLIAQKAVIDSLKELLVHQTEKEQVFTLNKLALECKGRFPEEGVLYAEKAIILAKKNNLPAEIAVANNNLGMIYRNQNNHEKANYFYLKGLKIYDSLGYEKDQGTLLNNIGVVYLDLNNFDLAEQNYLKAEKIFNQINNEEGLALTYNNLAIVYSYQEHFNKAIIYFEKSLELEQKRNNIQGIGECYNNIAALYYFDGKYAESIKYFLKSLEIDEKFDNSKGIATTLSNLGELYTETNQFRKAEEVLHKSLEIAKKINSNHDKETVLLNLAGLYEKQNQYQKAFQYFQDYTALKDSIFSIEKNKQIVELQTKYDTEKKDADLILKSTLIQKQTLQIEKTQRQKLILLISIAALTFLFILFYNWYKLKQQQKLDAEIIKERELGINAVFLAQENERKKIAKELHDGIGQQLSGLKLGWQSISEKIQKSEQFEKLSNALDNAYNDIRDISHRMMPKTLAEFGLVAALKDMFQASFEFSKTSYEFEVLGIENRLEEQIELNLFRIAQEICANIMKHAQATNVEFQLIKTKQNIIFTAIDNGIGLKPSAQEGIGLINIKSRVNSLNGSISIDSTENIGTTFTIRIPLKI